MHRVLRTRAERSNTSTDPTLRVSSGGVIARRKYKYKVSAARNLSQGPAPQRDQCHSGANNALGTWPFRGPSPERGSHSCCRSDSERRDSHWRCCVRSRSCGRRPSDGISTIFSHGLRVFGGGVHDKGRAQHWARHKGNGRTSTARFDPKRASSTYQYRGHVPVHPASSDQQRKLLTPALAAFAGARRLQWTADSRRGRRAERRALRVWTLLDTGA